MAGAALERVLHRLTGVKPIADGWVARCPGHDDQHQSLQISERTDLSVGLHCHAGCEKTALLTAMGLKFGDLFASTDKGKQAIAHYDYRDLNGTLLYQAVRFFPKEFRQRRPDGAGGWTWNMLGAKGKHVAYRLPDLKGHNVAVVCEGEKDVNRLWSLGIAATCNIGGAGKWGQSETKSLAAAGVTRVIILPDNDEAGSKHAEMVAQSVKLANLAVSVVELPGLGLHQDVSDWLDAGHTKDDLQSLLATKPYILPASTPAQPAVAPAPIVIEMPLAQPDALLDPLNYPLTQAGASDALRDRFGHRLRYDHQREQWFIWDGQRWRPDEDEAVIRMALDHARRWAGEIIQSADFLARKKWQDFTLKLEKRAELMTMITGARSLPPISVGANPWDRDPWMLCASNGVIDLRTGTLRPGNPAENISQQVAVPFDPEAQCPRWQAFLREVFMDDEEVVGFVQRAVGYSLTADMREQCFFLCIGTGSNGKSIFLNALESVIGSYGTRASMRLFIGDASEFHMADLAGARMVFASEAKPDTRLNEHVIKALTGGETQKAERKYGHPFTFRPVGKIWLTVNHVPKVVDDSFGFWRRVRLIPFNRTFTGSQEDRTLRDQLAAEASGILTWAVYGAHLWQTGHLNAPYSVTKATDEYQNSEDPLVDFLSDRCVFAQTGIETFAALSTAYNRWAENQRIPKSDRLSRRILGTHLKRRFETADVNGTRRYRGISLKDTEMWGSQPDMWGSPSPGQHGDE
jgi:putative DNA primase/helicase